MKKSLPVLVAAMVLLTGCSALQPGQKPTGTTGLSNTTGELDSNQYPPGVTTDGVTDPEELVDAHATNLAGTAYTLRHLHTELFDDSGLVAFEQGIARHEQEPDRSHYLYTTRGERARILGLKSADVEAWSNESSAVMRIESNGSTAYHEATGLVPTDLYERLYTYFSSFETAVAGQFAVNGTTITRIEATAVSDQHFLPAEHDGSDVSSVEFSALVGPDGLVHEYSLSYEYAKESATANVFETAKFTERGSAALERPRWVGVAVNATAADRRRGSS